MRHARFRLFGVLAAVALLAASCNWPMVGSGPDRTGYAPFQTVISPASVSQLTQQWTASVGSAASLYPGSHDPVVADGHVFVTGAGQVGAGQVYAFDASGSTNCTGTPPQSCNPQWSEAAGTGGYLTAPAVSSGAVWIGTDCPCVNNGAMNAYNESTGAPTFSGGQASDFSPAATDNTVYTSWTLPFNAMSFGGLGAMDATTGVPKFVAFSPALPTGPMDSNDSYGPPAVANGILYAVDTSTGTLLAFDATGTTNCQPTTSSSTITPNGNLGYPTYCTPLWTAQFGSPASSILASSNTMPAVANGYVYVGDSTGTLFAFPADGCGAATCSPAWSAQTNGAIESSPAVTGTTVFVGSDDGSLSAFPAKGCGAATCQPLWQAQTGAAVKSSPSVAGEIVYVGSDDDNLYAFNASGCGAATCTPLWQTNAGAPVETSPAIANGQVFITDTAGTLHAYGLPAAQSS
jgi:outer membrane protein assembly factor BamB